MPSTADPSPSTPRANYARRIKWLGTGFFAASALYSVAWFMIADFANKRIDSELAKSGPAKIECAKHEIRGFPFRAGLFCDSVSVTDERKGVRFAAGPLRSAAQVYNPWHVVGELDGPALVDAPGLLPLEIEWTLLHASARLKKPLPDRADVEAVEPAFFLRGEAGKKTKAASAARTSAHMRKEGADIALAADVQAMALEPAVTPGRLVPVLDASWDVLLKDGVTKLPALRGKPAEFLPGMSATIRSASLAFRDGGAIRISGPLSVSQSGLLSGDLTVNFEDGQKLGENIAKAAPEAASMLVPALSAASLAAGKDKTATLTLTIRDGAVSTGFIPLGTIPPIR